MLRQPLIGVQQGRDIRHSLRPTYKMHRKVHLTGTQIERIQISGTEVVKVVVSVVEGGMDIYLGELNGAAIPDARVVAPDLRELCFPIIGDVISIQLTPTLPGPLRGTIWILSDRRETE